MEILCYISFHAKCFRYHVPRSWLKPTQNLLVIFEELGGDPSKISLVKRSVSSVCADVSEYHPNIKNWHIESYGKSEEFRPPKVHLHCSPGQIISSIKFASFGTPLGTCGSYVQGACHSPASYAILEKVMYHTPSDTECYKRLVLSDRLYPHNTLVSDKFPRIFVFHVSEMCRKIKMHNQCVKQQLRARPMSKGNETVISGSGLRSKCYKLEGLIGQGSTLLRLVCSDIKRKEKG